VQLTGEGKGKVPEALSQGTALRFHPVCPQGFDREQDETRGLG